jgi:hypothetical protein
MKSSYTLNTVFSHLGKKSVNSNMLGPDYYGRTKFKSPRHDTTGDTIGSTITCERGVAARRVCGAVSRLARARDLTPR